MSKAPIFTRAAPTQGTQLATQMDEIRANLLGLVAAILVGGTVPGWNMTTSVALGEAAPGTAAQPARWYFRAGTGATTYWVKIVPTWDATTGAITRLVFWWSDNNNKDFDRLRDEAGNNAVSFTYDADLNLTDATWGKA